jgi:hypothetical protein
VAAERPIIARLVAQAFGRSEEETLAINPRWIEESRDVLAAVRAKADVQSAQAACQEAFGHR